MERRVRAHHLAAAAVLMLIIALGIAGHALATLAGDAAGQTEVRLGLLSRVQGLALERAERDAAVHRVANRLLMSDTSVDAGVAREIVDGTRALVRRYAAMDAYLSEVGHRLPATERSAAADRIRQIREAADDVAGRAEHLANDPTDPARLEAVAAATRALGTVLSRTRSHLEGTLERDRNRMIDAAQGTMLWCASLAVVALILGGVSLRRRAVP